MTHQSSATEVGNPQRNSRLPRMTTTTGTKLNSVPSRTTSARWVSSVRRRWKRSWASTASAIPTIEMQPAKLSVGIALGGRPRAGSNTTARAMAKAAT
jgi:hypothetical protein